jgi:hypothetical protein
LIPAVKRELSFCAWLQGLIVVAFTTIANSERIKERRVLCIIFRVANNFNSQHQQKNVNKNCMKIFSLAKNLFNIVMGIAFPYLLTHPHIKPSVLGGLFASGILSCKLATNTMQKE